MCRARENDPGDAHRHKGKAAAHMVAVSVCRPVETEMDHLHEALKDEKSERDGQQDSSGSHGRYSA